MRVLEDRPSKAAWFAGARTLHDRFMLPHFVKRDLSEVLAHLRQSGFDFEDAWFAAHFEFRFPSIGSVTADGVELELRRALEPWNVLAEEAVSGRTVRNVDSSLERIQVKLSGMTSDSRYVVTCNGRRVPLQPTAEPGVSVAGVRFRARNLSATLHPTVPVHAPLVFELIDLWVNRAIGQCTYHVAPPEGRVYTGRPVDAAEADARRAERFTVNTPAKDSITPPPAELNPIFPGTLDLRMPSPGLEESHRKRGAHDMTDLYQIPLRYGDSYDELSADGVTPRAHWAHLIDSLQAIGPEELSRRCARAERRIRENGITYNIYSDPLGANRPWEIDIVPFLISADEWRYIEERHHSARAVAEPDPRRSLRLSEPSQERAFPCRASLRKSRVSAPHGRVCACRAASYLHMLAVDLARSPDGQWWVLSDRTQAPSGSGYALENRTIVSDVLPNVFRSSNVLRLAPFFRAQRDALASLADVQQSAHRAADARPAQRDILRALLSRSLPRLHAC